MKNRKLIWVQDPLGRSGKSTFLKYLIFGNSGLVIRKLPLDKSDRLRMVVRKICERYNINGFAIDFTRILDEGTRIKFLFQIVEEIKNGHIVSAMFGAPMEAIIPYPFVRIMTNEDVSGYYHYLSRD